MRGRKPKPSFLKLIAGNPGRRPVNDAEPDPSGDLASAPGWMTEGQRSTWNQAARCSPPGLLREIDESVFVVWVVAKDLHQESTKKVAQYGAVIKSANGGPPQQSPYLSVMNKQAAIMLKAASEMGFSPSSRSRVKVEKGKGRGGNRFDDLKEIDEP